MADSFLARCRLRAKTKVSAPSKKKLNVHPRLSSDLLPVALKQLALEVGELVARSAHQIISSTLPKILQVIFADNAAIKHPHSTLHPGLVLDLVHDLFEGGHVGGVSVENLVSYREAFRGHNQSDNDLQKCPDDDPVSNRAQRNPPPRLRLQNRYSLDHRAGSDIRLRRDRSSALGDGP